MKCCSVIDCSVKQGQDISIFAVKEEWLKLNVGGWKEKNRLWICEKHFSASDVCHAVGKQTFVKRSAKPIFERY